MIATPHQSTIGYYTYGVDRHPQLMQQSREETMAHNFSG